MVFKQGPFLLPEVPRVAFLPPQAPRLKALRLKVGLQSRVICITAWLRPHALSTCYSRAKSHPEVIDFQSGLGLFAAGEPWRRFARIGVSKIEKRTKMIARFRSESNRRLGTPVAGNVVRRVRMREVAIEHV